MAIAVVVVRGSGLRVGAELDLEAATVDGVAFGNLTLAVAGSALCEVLAYSIGDLNNEAIM